MKIKALSGWLVVSTLALAGCPDDPHVDAGDTQGSDASDVTRSDAPSDTAADAAPGDVATTDAADVVSADGSDGAPADGGDTSCTLAHVLATTTDFTHGGYVSGTLSPLALATASLAPGSMVDQDHTVHASGCTAFDLWATNGEVVVLDPAHLETPRHHITLAPVPGGADGGTQSGDPVDIAVVSPTKAYVVQYNGASLAIVDPTRDGAAALTGTVDLSPLADSDGIPEASAIAVVGHTAYVALQQLTRSGFPWGTPAHSHVALIDTTTDQLIDADPSTPAIDGIQLTYANPQGRIAVSPGGHWLLLSSSGTYDDMMDGGLDLIDTTDHHVQGIPASTLHGDPSSAAFVTDLTLWVTVPTSDMMGATIYSLPVAGVAATQVAMSTSIAYGSLRRAPDGNMWAIDTGFALMGSIHAFTPAGTEITTAPLPFATAGVNTYSLDFVP